MGLIMKGFEKRIEQLERRPVYQLPPAAEMPAWEIARRIAWVMTRSQEPDATEVEQQAGERFSVRQAQVHH